MKVGVIGLGYVGLVSALGFARLGHDVVGVDVDERRVGLLRARRPPFFEPGLEEHLAGLDVCFTTKYSELLDREVVFIAVGTPPLPDGGQDLRFFRSAVLGLKEVGYSGVVVPRSTVLPGTTEGVVCPLFEHVGYNPEFLAEGRAFRDFYFPSRVVFGYGDLRALEVLRSVYAGVEAPRVELGIREAELVKYASNAFLAMKIAFANEIGNIAKKIGVDVYRVMDAVGLDPRIGRAFLDAGVGFGGSCFPKDVSALIGFARGVGYEPLVLEAVLRQNGAQPLRLVELLREKVGGDLRGVRVAVLGLAFKPDTDDVREAPSIKIVGALLDGGAEVHAYDPRAMNNFRRVDPRFATRVVYHGSARECVSGCDYVLVVTEWAEFRDPSLYEGKVVLEGRRVLGREGVCW